MKQLVSIVILVISLGVATSQDAPEDEWTRTLFEKLGQNPGLVVKEFSKVAPHHEQELQNILLGFTQADNGTLPDESPGCIGCQLIITVLTYLVKMGYTMDELKRPALVVCYLIFPLGDIPFLLPSPGTVVCPGVIDNYGHHIERIMKLNRLIPEESCYFIAMCNNPLPSFELPPLSEIILGITRHPDNRKRWEIPGKSTSHNYRTKRRVKTSRNWHEDEDILRVAQFTDIHMDEYYKEGEPTECGMPLCCRELPYRWQGPSNGSAGPRGELSCNVPPSTTKAFMERASTLNPDIVLYSGDSPPHHLWDETLEKQMNVTFSVAELLNDYFPDRDVGIYSTLGNHECFPSNMYYPDHDDTKELHDTFIGAYEELSKFTDEQKETINKAGYYSVRISEGLRLVTPNSNFGYTSNWYNLLHVHGNLHNEMFHWLTETLRKAREDGEKVIILSHHPVGGNVRGYDEIVSALMVEYSDIIILDVVGHNHKDEFRMFRDESGAAKGVQFLSQSANSYSNVNPGVRMYYFDKNTYDLLGYEQYFLDIVHAEGTPEVALLYKTDDEYGLDDLSPESMLDFASRMATDVDLFDKFYKNRVTGAGTEGSCSESCRRSTLCRQVTSTETDRDRCVEGPVPSGTPPSVTEPAPTDGVAPSVTEPAPTDGVAHLGSYSYMHITALFLLAMFL